MFEGPLFRLHLHYIAPTQTRNDTSFGTSWCIVARFGMHLYGSVRTNKSWNVLVPIITIKSADL